MTDPNGLLAAGADLSAERLLDAYRRGIFPWFGEDDPLLWWSPDPRMVLMPGELHVSRSLRRVIGSGRYRVTLDTAFAEVMSGCAEPREEDTGTWITAEMAAAYGHLASLGFAHSVEVWSDRNLVGGLYGVAIGRMFYGESMFSRRTDASKVEGIGLDEVIGATDQAVATAITAQIAKSLALAEALEPPFDQEILKTNTAGNKRVSDLIDSLDTLEGQFEELFVLYGLQVPKQE